MSSKFVSKRPHKKSRAGCKTCKTRKIKCDEILPKCTFCRKRDLACIYMPRSAKSESPSEPRSSPPTSKAHSPGSDEGLDEKFFSLELVKSPPPLVITSAGSMSPTDLRMMHHWSTVTWDSVAIGDDVAFKVMQKAIPKLAFEHEFLMNGLLGIASLHHQRLAPSPEARRQTDIYRGKALNTYRQALSQFKEGNGGFEATLIMSLLIVVLCSQDYGLESSDLIIVNWFVLYQGLKAIIMVQTYTEIRSLSIGPVFEREISPLKCDPVVPTSIIKMFQDIQPLDLDFPYLQAYCEVIDALGMLYASLKGDGLSEALYVRIISWPSYSNQDFTGRAKAKRPRALIILAYYLLFVKFVDRLWWIEGIAAREIKAIASIVGPEWALYMDVPLRALAMDNDENIRELMLR